jgi:hypothetical protein
LKARAAHARIMRKSTKDVAVSTDQRLESAKQALDRRQQGLGVNLKILVSLIWKLSDGGAGSALAQKARRLTRCKAERTHHSAWPSVRQSSASAILLNLRRGFPILGATNLTRLPPNAIASSALRRENQ